MKYNHFMRVKFCYNLTSDAKNWVRIIRGNLTSTNLSYHDKIKGIPQNLLESVLGTDEKNGLVIVENYLKSENKNREDVLATSVECLQRCWKKREEDYFKVLGTVLGKEILITDYHAHMTTMYFAPYYWPKNWFMVTFWNSLSKQLTTIAHEILHIEFMRHYSGFLEKHNVAKHNLIDITESLTCLLNIEQFKNVLLVQDYGYEKHREMREYVFDRYSQCKSLENVLGDVLDNYLVSRQNE